MHRALQTPELFRLICLEITAVPRDAYLPGESRHELTKEQSRTLASLARTCTKTSGIALDLLWVFQNTFLRALDCMPRGTWNKDKSVRRVISSLDWERPSHYLRRVRFLSCSDASFPKDINLPALCETLRLSLPTPHLFPNLRGITWTFDDPSSLCSVASFLTPTITTVVLGKFGALPTLTLLSTLAVRCPSLRDVKLIQDPPAAPQVDVVSSFVQTLQQIRFLDLRYLDAAGWDYLANLPSLEVLLVQTLTSLPPPVTGNSPKKFGALRQLLLVDTPFENIMAAIGVLSCTLIQVHFGFWPPPAPSSLMQICVAIQKHLSGSDLILLGLGTDKTTSQLIGLGPPATITTIRPLLSFTNLFHVTLGASTGLDLDDNAMCSMAKAWPRISLLYLPCFNVAAHIRTTLLSLLHLAENCPKLGRLRLPVDASVVPVLAGDEQRTVSQHTLYSWKVGDSVIASPLGVARFLSGLFPNLRSIRSSRSREEHALADAEAVNDMWGTVESAMIQFNEVLEEERMRMSVRASN
ncbi:hypothetical protein C8R46DRAFT_348810 [Mycena filopes]|nr:hypothetical protein C8R46DRAFT_348810 [Mycena filopes]